MIKNLKSIIEFDKIIWQVQDNKQRRLPKKEMKFYQKTMTVEKEKKHLGWNLSLWKSSRLPSLRTVARDCPRSK
jgi:peptidoglycan hydrolase CwlO-like protein